MKELSFIGISLVLLMVAALLFWQHSRLPSDAEVRQKVSGSWTGKNKNFVMTITPDGNYAYGTSPGHNAVGGTWQISDGNFIMTITHSTAHGASQMGGVVRCRVIHLDEHEFAFDMDGETMTLKR